MLGRALSLATVSVLIGCLAILPARAQNLEAGKSPSQIFGESCTACHKAPRGLLKSVQPGTLPGFLRQHYTTSSDMASLLSAYLISNGANDKRYVGTQAKQSPDAKPEANSAGPLQQTDRNGRPSRPNAAQQEASRPDIDGNLPGGRQGRNAKRLSDPAAVPPASEGQSPAQAASERGPDGRRLSAKQRLGSRGKPATEEPAKPEPKDEASKGEPAKEAAPGASDQPADARSAAVRTDTPNGEAAAVSRPLRTDPVPAVTPAPVMPEIQFPPVQPIETGPAVVSAPATTAATSAPKTVVEPTPFKPSVPPPALMATAPPEPVTPAGPPSPPISQ